MKSAFILCIILGVLGCREEQANRTKAVGTADTAASPQPKVWDGSMPGQPPTPDQVAAFVEKLNRASDKVAVPPRDPPNKDLLIRIKQVRDGILKDDTSGLAPKTRQRLTELGDGFPVYRLPDDSTPLTYAWENDSAYVSDKFLALPELKAQFNLINVAANSANRAISLEALGYTPAQFMALGEACPDIQFELAWVYQALSEKEQAIWLQTRRGKGPPPLLDTHLLELIHADECRHGSSANCAILKRELRDASGEMPATGCGAPPIILRGPQTGTFYDPATLDPEFIHKLKAGHL